MNYVTNNQMEQALADIEYQKIMGKASLNFASILSRDELETCKMNALWKALREYDEEKAQSGKGTTKFTSFLYRGVILECKTMAKFVARGRQQCGTMHKNISEQEGTFFIDELMEEVDHVKDGDILRDYFIENMTIEEISAKRQVSKQTVGSKKKKALERLEKRLR